MSALFQKIKPCFFFTCAFALVFVGCKKETDSLAFTGVVKRGNQGQNLSGVNVTAQTQLITNGVFNSEYSALGSAVTDANGAYQINFETATYASLRLQLTRSGYHRRFVDVPPSYFDIQNTYTKNMFLYPQATIELHISDDLALPYDQILMQYRDVDFECDCCNSEWKNIAQPNIDTTFSCMVYGDQFVHYQYRWINTDLDTLISDSIYCPAFDTQHIELHY